jgi:hypothetical protein
METVLSASTTNIEGGGRIGGDGRIDYAAIVSARPDATINGW